MAIKLRKISETYKAKIYTEDGYFLGEVEDAIIIGNKIDEWKIKVYNQEFRSRGINGLFIKHILIKAMGQIWLVSKAVYSVINKTPEEPEETSIKEENKNIVSDKDNNLDNNKENKKVRIEEI